MIEEVGDCKVTIVFLVEFAKVLAVTGLKGWRVHLTELAVCLCWDPTLRFDEPNGLQGLEALRKLEADRIA